VVEQVADQAAHLIGLLVDDPKELQHLGRLGWRRGVQTVPAPSTVVITP